MKKCIVILLSLILIVFVLANLAVAGEFLKQKEDIIRLHVVGESNTETDQALKLLVRDAILSELSGQLESCETAPEAGQCIENNLEHIGKTAEQVLHSNGVDCTVKVTYQKEPFPTRYYDTFTLPSGVYQSLRVEIGKAEGRNWWCVVFPSFCYGAESESFADVAAGFGFSQPLTDTLAGKKEYRISFLFLDFIGKLENIFHFG